MASVDCSSGSITCTGWNRLSVAPGAGRVQVAGVGWGVGGGRVRRVQRAAAGWRRWGGVGGGAGGGDCRGHLPLKRRVPLDVLAVLVQRRRADALRVGVGAAARRGGGVRTRA